MVIRTLAPQTVWFIFPKILVFVFLSIFVDYLNCYTCVRSLGTAAKIKIMREPSLIFTDLWFGTYVLFMRVPLEKCKIMSWKKEGFEDHDDLLVF
jgi:hypothetical protein